MNNFEEIEDGEPVLRASSLIDLVLAEHLRLEEPVGRNATSCLKPPSIITNSIYLVGALLHYANKTIAMLWPKNTVCFVWQNIDWVVMLPAPSSPRLSLVLPCSWGPSRGGTDENGSSSHTTSTADAHTLESAWTGKLKVQCSIYGHHFSLYIYIFFILSSSTTDKKLENLEFIFEFKLTVNFEFIFEIFVNF